MTICVAIKNCIVVQLIHFLVARLMVIMLQKVSCSQYFCFLNNISSKIFSRIIFLLSKRKKKKKKKKSLYLYVIVVSQPKRSFFPKCFFFSKIVVFLNLWYSKSGTPKNFVFFENCYFFYKGVIFQGLLYFQKRLYFSVFLFSFLFLQQDIPNASKFCFLFLDWLIWLLSLYYFIL